MNILFICDEYPPGKNGGIGSAVSVLARELADTGHNVFVCGLYSYEYGGADFEEDQKVKVYRLRCGPDLGSYQLLYRIFRKLPSFVRRRVNGSAAFAKFLTFAADLIRQEKIDIIEMPDWHNFAHFTGVDPVWPQLKAPLVVKSHGSYTYFQTELGLPVQPGKRKNDRLLFERADALSSVSSYTAEVNRRLFDLTKPAKILYNSVAIDGGGKTAHRKSDRVVYSGSLTPKKGIEKLIAAWNIVGIQRPQLKLYVYGKGKTEHYKKLLKAEVKSSVHFMGHVQREILMSELREATLAVFPSYSETFGLMCIEAMSAGCPVIYTKRSVGPEIVKDEESGVLIDPDDIQGIAGAIIRLADNEGLRNSFAGRALEDVRNKFNIKNSALMHIAFYRQVISSFMATNNATN